MKGIVFTEFLEMVESRYSADVVDEILEGSALPSGGIYTSVGTYDHGEMISLLSALGKHTGLGNQELLCAFGEYLFGRFAGSAQFAGVDSPRQGDCYCERPGVPLVHRVEARRPRHLRRTDA